MSVRGSFFSWCLRRYKSIMQNKPNSLNAKTTATSFTTKPYENNPPRLTRKNKPKRSQFPQRNTPPRPRRKASLPGLAGRYATRNTRNKPNQTHSCPGEARLGRGEAGSPGLPGRSFCLPSSSARQNPNSTDWGRAACGGELAAAGP